MEKMIEILKKQLEIYQEILKISENKTDIIVKDKVEELKDMVSREEELIAKFIPLEKQRITLLKDFSKTKGFKDILKIPELVEYFPDEKEELTELRVEVLDVTKKIKVRNEMNEKLIKNSLEYINFSVGLMTGTNSGTGTYGKQGETNRNEAKKFLDISL